jgi:Beta-lactamase enzyme family
VRVPVILGCVATALGLLAVGLVATPYVAATGVPARLASSADPGPPTLLEPRPVALTEPGFHAWALLKTHTGAISGSDNLADTSDTVSMIKAWLAADFLRRAAQRKQTPTADQLHTLSIMIRDSDNQAAEDTYRGNGAADSIQRLIKTCGLTDSSAVPDRWSETVMSPRDAVRMGACLADGRAAGPKWTSWVLGEMRHVRGDGRFGIVDALPAGVANTVAIKNGWLLRDETGLWHVNCLAVGDGWVLAVMMRYDGSLGFAHGGAVCESVATQLINPALI